MRAASTASSALGWLCTEWVEHQRSNSLHRENLALAVRIHEAQALAKQDYHRVLTRAANDQHSRETLQRRYQHEEIIDLERRVATRENIRDDWRQLSGKAETVLIMNTLVLAVAFAMLIEGHLPDSAPLTMPATSVAYYSAIGCSVCLLMCSVRFAMELRIRVGCTIVDEMGEAIHRTTENDSNFRSDPVYLRCNRPKVTVPACDDRLRQESTWPLTRQLGTTSRKDTQKSKVKAGRMVRSKAPRRYSAGGAPVQKLRNSGYEDLSWVQSDKTGFSMHSALRQLAGPFADQLPEMPAVPAIGQACEDEKSGFSDECGNTAPSTTHHTSRSDRPKLRKTPSFPDLCDSYPSEASSAAAGCGPSAPNVTTPWASCVEEGIATDTGDADSGDESTGESVESVVGSAGESGAESDLESAADISAPKLSTCGTACSGKRSFRRATSKDSLNFLMKNRGADAQEELYQVVVGMRLEQNESDQATLKTLQTQRCQPWGQASQQLLFSGCFMLLNASSLLVFGRYYMPSIPLGTEVPLAAPLAAWGFATPCAITGLMLLYLQALLNGARHRHRSIRDTRRRRQRSRHRAAGINAQTLGSATVTSEPSSSFEANSSTSVPLDEQADRDALCVAHAVMISVCVSFLAFVSASALVAHLSPHEQHVQSTLSKQLEQLTVSSLPNAEGRAWPDFWAPTRATWLSQQDSLVLAGNGQIVEVVLAPCNKGKVGGECIHPVRFHRTLDILEEIGAVCAADGTRKTAWVIRDKSLQMHASGISPSGALATGVQQVVMQRNTTLSANKMQGQKVVGCLATGSGAVEVMLAGGDDLQVLTTVEMNLQDCAESKHNQDNCWPKIRRKWRSQWLLADKLVAATLQSLSSGRPPSSTTHPRIDIIGGADWPARGLVLLLTIHPNTEEDSKRQMLALLSTAGHALRCSVLPVSSHSSSGGIWATFAVDVGSRRLFLVSAGPEPEVAEVQLTDWNP